MSTEAQKLGTILIVDDEVEVFYKHIVKDLVLQYKIKAFKKKSDIMGHPDLSNLKLALVDLNLDRPHDGFKVIDYLEEFYPLVPVLVVTQENIGTTVLDALGKNNVQRVLIKVNYDKAEWIKIIQQTLVDNSTAPLDKLYLTYHDKDKHLARLILEGINRKGKCIVIDGKVSGLAESKSNFILALLSKNVDNDQSSNVIHTINWGMDNKKVIKGAWIDMTRRDPEKTPRACSGNNMVANFKNCLKALDSNRISLLESLLNPEREFKEEALITRAFNDEIDKVLKAYQL